MWASPFLFFLFYPKDFPCARACSQIISYAILKESKLCVFPVFLAFQRGSSYGIHYHLRLIRGGQKLPPPPFWRTWAFTAWTICLWPSSPTSPACAWPGRAPANTAGWPWSPTSAGARPLTSSFRPWTACREMHLDYQLLFIEAADEDIGPPVQGDPPHPPPHPPGLLPAGGGEAGAPGAGARPRRPATFSTPPGSTCPNSGGSCSACSAWGRWRRA